MENQEKKKRPVPSENSENTKPKKKRVPSNSDSVGKDAAVKKKKPETANTEGQEKKKRKKRPPQVKETGTIPTKEVMKKLGEAEEAKKNDEPKEKKENAKPEGVEEPQKKRKKKKQKDAKVVEASAEINKSAEHDMDSNVVSVPDDVDEVADGKKGKFKSVIKKIFKWFLIIIGCILAVAALLYLGVSVFFMSHFYYGTTINGIDYSMQSVKDVEADFKRQAEEYVLTIEEKMGVTETISGKDIALKYEDTNVEEALSSQNAFMWPIVFYEPEEAVEVADVTVSFDKTALDQKVAALKCITETMQTEPTSSYPRFNGEKFEPAKEQTGFKVDVEAMKTAVSDHVSDFSSVINMEEAGCYALPPYLSDSPEVIAACDAMNEYCKASVTYTFGEETEVVDASVISQWLTCDETLNVTFNPDLVREFMVEFGKRHDTVGTTRQITTPTGKVAEVTGGTYGWSVDEEAETEALIAHIENGEVITKEPIYVQTAASHGEQDWGTTYIEVDLTTQHMWYIVDSAVQFEADVVTGTPIPSRITPQGVYDILEKLRNKVLRGTRYPDGTYEYESPVSFWMRVTYSGIGFHDATWQPWFGGDRYQRNGSHGCINMSWSDAQTLYNMIPVRVPVVIHY